MGSYQPGGSHRCVHIWEGHIGLSNSRKKPAKEAEEAVATELGRVYATENREE